MLMPSIRHEGLNRADYSDAHFTCQQNRKRRVNKTRSPMLMAFVLFVWSFPFAAAAEEWSLSTSLGPAVHRGSQATAWGLSGTVDAKLSLSPFWAIGAELGTSAAADPDWNVGVSGSAGALLRYNLDVFRYVPYATVGLHSMGSWLDPSPDLVTSFSIGVEHRSSRAHSTGVEIETFWSPLGDEIDHELTSLRFRFVWHFRL